jgi:hypothetical protein
MRSGKGNKVVGRIACIALMAAIPAVAGCGQSEDGVSGEQAQWVAASQSPSAAKATVQDVVGRWVAAIIAGNHVEACQLMGHAASATSAAKAMDANACQGSGAEAQQAKQVVERLRGSFTPKQSSGAPTMQVAEVPVTDNTATVSGDDVSIDGRSLTAVVLSNSSGIEAGQLKLEIEAANIGGSWYVTDFDLSIG